MFKGAKADVTHRGIQAIPIEEKLKKWSEAAPSGVFRTCVEGRWTYACKNTQKFFLCSEAQLLGSGWQQFVQVPKVDELAEHWHKSIHQTYELSLLVQVPRPDQTLRSGIIRLAADRDKTGKIIGFMGSISDITDLILSRQRVERREQRINSFLKNTVDAVYCLEFSPPVPASLPIETQIARFLAHGVLVEANELFTSAYGFKDPVDMLGQSPSQAWPDTTQIMGDLYRQFIERGYQLHRAPCVFPQAQLEDKHFLVSVMGVIDAGQVHRLWGTVQDVTRKVKAEQAALKAKAIFQVAFEFSPVGKAVIALDPHRFIQANSALGELIGYSSKELLDVEDARAFFNSLIHPSSPHCQGSALEGIWTGETQGEQLAVRLRHKSGRWIWVKLAISQANSETSTPLMILQMVDITDQKNAELALARRAEEFELLAENSPDLIMRVNRNLELTYANSVALKSLGTAHSGLIGKPLADYMPPALASRLESGLAEVLRSKIASTIEATINSEEDRTYYDVRLVPETNAEGHATSALALLRDITQRKRSEQTALEHAARTHAILETAAEGILTMDQEGTIKTVNRSALDMFGYQSSDVVGQNLAKLLPLFGTEIQLPTDEAQLQKYIVETTAKNADNAKFPIRLAVSTTNYSKPSLFTCIIHDLSEQREAESKLAYQASHDSLTGLPNRAHFVSRLVHALNRAAREDSRVAVLFLDLDRFKVVNDSLGHAVGDQLLIAVSKRLKRMLRTGDTVARFGGDEFAILCENVAHPTDVIDVSKRILEIIERPFVLNGKEAYISTSIGIALNQETTIGAEELILNADVAMYRAKEAGRSRFQIYDEHMRAWAEARLEMEGALRHASSKNELLLYYQPIINLQTTRPWSMEAMLRWRRGGTLLPPSAFIGLAEESRLIVDIGFWVLQEACTQASYWIEKGKANNLGYISVNLSARQIRQPNFPEMVETALKKSGLPANKLVLELKESALLQQGDDCKRTLDALKSLGVRLAIDDFGTGQSALSSLRSLPVDILKLDRSFIRSLGTDAQSSTIVTAITDLAHALDLDVVGEGVETPEQFKALKSLGCDSAQGFYLARPQPPEAWRKSLGLKDDSLIH